MSERSAVQNPMLKYADKIGWKSVSRSEAMQMRRGDAGLYFADVLETQLMKLNSGILDESRCGEIVRQLNLLRPTLEGNEDALSWLRGERSIFVPDENRERNVTLIDYDNPDNNLFHVTDEWTQKGVVHRNRADVVFLINGIPVAIVETKSANKRDGLAEGVGPDPTLPRRNAGDVCHRTTVRRHADAGTFLWCNMERQPQKPVQLEHRRTHKLYEEKVKTFFDRDRFLKVLQESIIFQSRDDALTKVVLRQHQTRAVEKVIERVHDPDKRRGLIWHTQGSGKTLTMITIAAQPVTR